MAREYHYTPTQIDELTDEEINWLCKPPKRPGEDDFEAGTESYQTSYIKTWVDRGLTMEQIKEKWEKERGTGWVPDTPWIDPNVTQ